MKPTEIEITFFSFSRWLAQNKWPHKVMLRNEDFIELAMHFQNSSSIISAGKLLIGDTTVTPSGPIDRPEILDMSTKSLLEDINEAKATPNIR